MRSFALGICLFFLLCGLAEARPRDEAMARAYRCAAQPMTRVWLDCYYGAAQPVRGALGLPPVPSAQAQLAEGPPPPGQPADISIRDRVMADAAHCATLVEDRRWLDCFYAATAPARSMLGLASLSIGPVIVPNGASPPPPSPRPTNSFLPGIFGETVVQAQARMVSYSFDANKKFTIILDNGQVWHQLSGDSSLASWHKPARGYLVTITNGAFGSHNLTVRDLPGMFKVRRAS
jgi:hypothetical protein